MGFILGNCGKKLKLDPTAIEAAVKAVPVHKRQTLRAKTFVTFQKVMDLAIELKGGNNYKLPHLKKDSTNMDCTTYNVECSNDHSVEMSLLDLNCRLEEEAELAQLVDSLTL